MTNLQATIWEIRTHARRLATYIHQVKLRADAGHPIARHNRVQIELVNEKLQLAIAKLRSL